MDPQALAKRSTQDWMRLRDAFAQIKGLKEDLRIDPFLVQRMEEGLTNFPDITEYLNNSLSYVFQSIAKAARSSPSLLELSNIESVLRILLFTLGIEYGLSNGNLKPTTKLEPESRKDYSINEILGHIKKLQANFPELSHHKKLLNVLELYDTYLQYQEDFRRESPKIDDQEAPAFFTSFKLKIDNILQEIKQNYLDLLSQLKPDQSANTNPSILVNDALSRVILSLAQEISRLLSLINLALEEGGNFREEFLRTSEKKTVVLALVKEQANILRNLLPGNNDLACYLGRQIKATIRNV